MQSIMSAMGTWIAQKRKELTARVGAFKADIIMGPGRYRQEHPKGAGYKKNHKAAEQMDVGCRAFNRRREYLRKLGAI